MTLYICRGFMPTSDEVFIMSNIGCDDCDHRCEHKRKLSSAAKHGCVDKNNRWENKPCECIIVETL